MKSVKADHRGAWEALHSPECWLLQWIRIGTFSGPCAIVLTSSLKNKLFSLECKLRAPVGGPVEWVVIESKARVESKLQYSLRNSVASKIVSSHIFPDNVDLCKEEQFL